MSANLFGSKLIESHHSYRVILSANNPRFNQRMLRIMNKNFGDLPESGIFKLRDSPTPNLFFFEASRYNSALREQLQDFIVRQIDHFYNNFDSTFAVVYVHSSIFDFLAFRRMMEKWPEHFFYRLRRVYILGPSILVKIVETFSIGTFYRLCDDLFLNIDTEEALLERDGELLKQIGETPTPTQGKRFAQSIKIIENELYGKKLDQYDLSFGRYPKIVLQLLQRLLKNPLSLRVQGIFRKSCDHDQLQRLQGEIIGKKPNAIDVESDVFVVCGCLKKIFNNLRLPLFNYTIYSKIINFQGGDEIEFIRGLLGEMEYVNNKTFVLMLVFLTDYIVSQQEYNKMSAYNLAVIFGPCFFRPKEYDLKDLVYSGKFAKVLVTLFQQQQKLIEKAERGLARGTLQQLMKGDKFS